MLERKQKGKVVDNDEDPGGGDFQIVNSLRNPRPIIRMNVEDCCHYHHPHAYD